MRTDKWIFFCFLILFPALIYVSGFSDQLIWDSRPVILENELLKENVPIYKAFISGYWQTTSQRLEEGYDYYRPLMIASFMVEKRIWGLDPLRLQLTNLIFFIFTGCLFYLILNRLSHSERVAQYAALLFIFHPLQLDNINWIVGRCDLLMLLCAFSCWLLLDLYFQKQKKWQLFLGVLSFFLALLSKEAALFFLPFFGVIYSSKFRQKEFWHGVVMLVAVTAIFWFLKSSVIGRGDFPIRFFLPFSETVQVIVGTIGYYGKAILFPFGFTMFLPVDQVASLSYLVMGLIWTIALAFLGYFARKDPQLVLPLSMIVIFLFFYLIMIFTPLFPFSISTRYMLLPAGGVCFLIGLILEKLNKKLATTLLLLILIGFSLSIFARQTTYRSEYDFWQNALTAAPKNSFLLMKTAQQKFLKGELVAAEKLLQRALQQKMKPETAVAIAILLAEIKRKQAIYSEAKQWVERGLSLPVKGMQRAQFWKEKYLIALAQGDLKNAEFSLKKVSEELKRKDLPQMMVDLYVAFAEWAKAFQALEQFEPEERSRQIAKIENLQKTFSLFSLEEKISYFEQRGIFRLAYDCAHQNEETVLSKRLDLLRLALLAGEGDFAYRLIDKLLDEHRKDYRVLNSLGLIYMKLYRLEEAINYFRQSLQLKADQPNLIDQIRVLEKLSK